MIKDSTATITPITTGIADDELEGEMVLEAEVADVIALVDDRVAISDDATLSLQSLGFNN